jgi:hypothetical protein
LKLAAMVVIVGVGFILLGVLAPQASITAASNSLSTNQFLPSHTNNLTYTVHLSKNNVFYGYPFAFKGISFNQNKVLINGVDYRVNTLVTETSGVVFITLWLKSPVNHGSAKFYVNFAADYVLNYSTFHSANFLTPVNNTSPMYYFSENAINYVNTGIGAVLILIGSLIFIRKL